MALPFKVRLRPGRSPFRQVVYAVKKAVVGGGLQPGDKFPSVRALSQALKINPNTAHKVVAELTREGLLEVHPGRGTVVAEVPPASRQQRTVLLKDDLEQLVVEARHLSIDLDELVKAVKQHWVNLSSSEQQDERIEEHV